MKIGKSYKSSGGKIAWKEKLKRINPEEREMQPINTLEIKSGFPF